MAAPYLQGSPKLDIKGEFVPQFPPGESCGCNWKLLLP